MDHAWIRSCWKKGLVGATAAAVAATAAVTFTAAMEPAGASPSGSFVPCSGPTGGTAGLDAAITAANAAGGGTITLAPQCTYTLSARANVDLGAGLTDVSSAITIDGRGATITRATTAPQLHLLFVDPTGDLTLNRVTLTGGLADAGGAVYNLGTLTLQASQLAANSATAGGGAVYNQGTLTLQASKVTGNRVGGSASTFGGGIVSFAGSVTVSDSLIDGNSASSNGTFAVGGGIYADSTDLTVDHSVVWGNTVTATGNAIGQGGGLVTGGSLVVTDSVITGNSVTSQIGNNAGGGIYLDYGTVSLERSFVGANQPDNCYPAIQGCPS